MWEFAQYIAVLGGTAALLSAIAGSVRVRLAPRRLPTGPLTAAALDENEHFIERPDLT
jgi:hypothetical protein